MCKRSGSVRALALTALLAALPAAAAATPDDDFEPERARSLAIGPLPSASPLPSLEVGYLRSGFRFDLGLIAALDLVLRVDTMLLYDGLGAQSGGHIGFRFTPIAEDAFHLGLEFTGGKVLIPARANTVSLTALRGELVLGAIFDFGNLYGRLAVRGVDSDVAGLGWSRDEEFGFGVERALGRWIVGAEAFAWAQPRHASVAQWRIRVGFAP